MLKFKDIKPMLEKMIDVGISEKELIVAGQMVDIAKDLVEYDISCKKLEQMGGDEMDERRGDNPRKVY